MAQELGLVDRQGFLDTFQLEEQTVLHQNVKPQWLPKTSPLSPKSACLPVVDTKETKITKSFVSHPFPPFLPMDRRCPTPCLSRNPAEGRESFNAKAQSRKDAKRTLKLIIRATKR